MKPNPQSLPASEPFASMTRQVATERPGVRTIATDNHDAIRRWAAAHHADPATGEATRSGPAKVAVNDGGAGVRFNFPGFAPFRPIEWSEWFEQFDDHHLIFVFEAQDDAQVATRADALSASRGHEAGHDREDWFQAERELRQLAGGESPSVRYRFITAGVGTDNLAPST